MDRDRVLHGVRLDLHVAREDIVVGRREGARRDDEEVRQIVEKARGREGAALGDVADELAHAPDVELLELFGDEVEVGFIKAVCAGDAGVDAGAEVVEGHGVLLQKIGKPFAFSVVLILRQTVMRLQAKVSVSRNALNRNQRNVKKPAQGGL